MEQLKQQVRDLTPKKWESFLSWVVSGERRRRETEKAVDEAVAASIKLNIDKGVLDGAAAGTEDDSFESLPEWVDPQGVQEKMYFNGDVVTYNGDAVLSEYPGLNRWEPSELEPGVWSKVDIKPESEPAVEEGEDGSSN